MALTVVGVFDNASEAQQAVEALVSDGFSRSSIDLSATQAGSSSDGNTSPTGDSAVPDRHRNTSGTMTEEAVDDTKDMGSSIGNFFSSLFGGNDDTDRYSRVAERSSIVAVHAQSEDEAERAADILDDNGAVDVNERDAQHGATGMATGAGMTGMGMTSNTMDMDTTNRTTTDGDQTIKVVEESMPVGEQQGETGGVRVRSRIVRPTIEEHLRLREERTDRSA